MTRLFTHFTSNIYYYCLRTHTYGPPAQHIAEAGGDAGAVQHAIHDLVVKTLIAGESTVTRDVARDVGSRAMHDLDHLKRPVCYELFGFDVLLDADLKPWIIEVNVSPSVMSPSPLDRKVKGLLLSDIFNLVGVALPDLLSSSPDVVAALAEGAAAAAAAVSATVGGGGGKQGGTASTAGRRSASSTPPTSPLGPQLPRAKPYVASGVREGRGSGARKRGESGSVTRLEQVLRRAHIGSRPGPSA